MFASFNRFEIQMTKNQAFSASHSGPCDNDVDILLSIPAIRRQLKTIPDDKLANELREYGAWDNEQLMDRKENEARIIWIAANNIAEEIYSKKKGR